MRTFLTRTKRYNKKPRFFGAYITLFENMVRCGIIFMAIMQIFLDEKIQPKRMDAKMVLYHGTTKSRGEQIVKEKCLSKDAEPTYGEGYGGCLKECLVLGGENLPDTLATTKGYVYLTHSLFYAMYYGNKHCLLSNEDKEFYIFKVDIPENILEIDSDEIRITTNVHPETVKDYKQSLDVCRSVRTPQSINKFEYMIFDSEYKYTEESSLVMKIVKEFNKEFDTSNKYLEQYIKELHEELDKKNWITM